MDAVKIQENSLLNFDGFMSTVTEDGEGGAPIAAGAPLATLDTVSGMGAPVLAGRSITGSGDVASPAISKKKKKKVKSFNQFITR